LCLCFDYSVWHAPTLYVFVGKTINSNCRGSQGVIVPQIWASHTECKVIRMCSYGLELYYITRRPGCLTASIHKFATTAMSPSCSMFIRNYEKTNNGKTVSAHSSPFPAAAGPGIINLCTGNRRRITAALSRDKEGWR